MKEDKKTGPASGQTTTRAAVGLGRVWVPLGSVALGSPLIVLIRVLFLHALHGLAAIRKGHDVLVY